MERSDPHEDGKESPIVPFLVVQSLRLRKMQINFTERKMLEAQI